MSGGWVVGLVVVAALGVGAILWGALADRRRNRIRAEQLQAPPSRAIPRFEPGPTTPQYLTELMARRPPTDRPGTDLDEADRRTLRDLLDDEATTRIPAGYASAAYRTDAATGWGVLDRPRVLVCADSPQTARELLDVLEKVALAGVPLVLAAPSLGRSVAELLEVNVIQQRIRAVAVVSPDPTSLDTVLAATGARLVSRFDLQASYLTDADLGRCDRWVSGPDASWIVSGPTGATTDAGDPAGRRAEPGRLPPP